MTINIFYYIIPFSFILMIIIDKTKINIIDNLTNKKDC